MAIITTDTFLDDGTARTAGETWTINNNARFTIRTDTRWHANSPASMTGAISSQTINEGEILYEGRNVRWMPYDTGSGNVPAIGTTVSQGGVTGYLLGVWPSLTDAPTAVGASMPVSGFIKFREVENGPFSAGVLTGIGASATGPDVTGWIEIVSEQTRDINIPRLGRFRAYGDRFFLGTTNGTVGQQFQVPTNGGGVDTSAPGAWIETAPASDTYEYWPSCRGVANSWAYQHVGQPPEESDIRQKLLSDVGNGILQMGENVTITGIYDGQTPLSCTYTDASSRDVQYSWDNGKFYFDLSSHNLDVGTQVGIQFTTGDAFTPTNRTGIYTVSEILSHNTFAVDFPDPGGGWNGLQGGLSTIRWRVGLVITSNPLGTGHDCYCDFTTGTGVDGNYKVIEYNTANTFNIHYPRTSALTTGNVSVYFRTVITTAAAHSLQPGRRVKLRFTSGTGVDGIYTVDSIPTTTTFTINLPFFGLTGGNVEIDFQLGYVAPAGCRVWIPNIILRQCASGSRAVNAIPHATVATRPEFITTSSGDLDINYVYGDWYMNFSQPYKFLANYVATTDRLNVDECNQTPIIKNIGVSSTTGQAGNAFYCGSMQQGIDVDTVTTALGVAPGSTQSGIGFGLIFGGTAKNLKSMFINYLRPVVSYNVTVDTCFDFSVSDVFMTQGYLRINAGNNIDIKNVDIVDRLVGYSGSYNPISSVVTTESTPDTVKVEGITFGIKGAVRNVIPGGVSTTNSANNCIIRNAGTIDNPLQGRIDGLPYLAGVGTMFSTPSRTNYKFQNAFVDWIGGTCYTDTNDAKDCVYENIMAGTPYNGNKSIMPLSMNAKNSRFRNVSGSHMSATAISVFGTFFGDVVNGFNYSTVGEYSVHCNEPSDQKLQYVTVVSGNPKFNANSGVWLQSVGDSIEFEDEYFRKGYTSFYGDSMFSIPDINGATATSIDVEYQLDTGFGFSGVYKPLRVQYRGGSSGSTGSPNITLTNGATFVADNVQVGDYVWGSSVGRGARVQSINSNIITLTKENITSVSGNISFCRLYTENITPDVGFRMKVRITAKVAGSPAVTRVKVMTRFTKASLAQAIYPLDTNTITFTGLPTGCDTVVLTAGTTTILDQKDSLPGTTYSYVYSGAQTVDVGFIKPGYIPFYLRNLSLSASDSTIPVQLTPDRNYA